MAKKRTALIIAFVLAAIVLVVMIRIREKEDCCELVPSYENNVSGSTVVPSQTAVADSSEANTPMASQHETSGETEAPSVIQTETAQETESQTNRETGSQADRTTGSAADHETESRANHETASAADHETESHASPEKDTAADETPVQSSDSNDLPPIIDED